MKKFADFISEDNTNLDADKFIAHMEKELNWNGASVFKNEDGTFSYSCMPGSSVSKDIKEAAKDFGVDVKVEKITSENYTIIIKKVDVIEEDDNEPDYSELSWKMDKYMPEETEIQDEYHEILSDEKMDKATKIAELVQFFNNHADEERMEDYMPDGGTIEGFVAYLIGKSKI